MRGVHPVVAMVSHIYRIRHIVNAALLCVTERDLNRRCSIVADTNHDVVLNRRLIEDGDIAASREREDDARRRQVAAVP